MFFTRDTKTGVHFCFQRVCFCYSSLFTDNKQPGRPIDRRTDRQTGRPTDLEHVDNRDAFVPGLFVQQRDVHHPGRPVVEFDLCTHSVSIRTMARRSCFAKASRRERARRGPRVYAQTPNDGGRVKEEGGEIGGYSATCPPQRQVCTSRYHPA